MAYPELIAPSLKFGTFRCFETGDWLSSMAMAMKYRG